MPEVTRGVVVILRNGIARRHSTFNPLARVIVAVLAVVLFICSACDARRQRDAPVVRGEAFSIVVTHDDAFGSRTEYPPSPAPVRQTILEATDYGTITWMKRDRGEKPVSRRLTTGEIQQLRDRVREFVATAGKTDEPGSIVDLETITVKVSYGDRGVTKSFNMNVEEFFCQKRMPWWDKSNDECNRLQRFIEQLTPICHGGSVAPTK